MIKIVEIYKQVFSVLQKSPTILFLFLILGIFDAIALTVLFLAPIPPISTILAPIIRTFWSEQYLHYPSNFLLLPKLFGHAHFVISTVVGVFVTGLIIKKIEAEESGQRISTFSAAGDIFKKYFSLVIVWLISYGIFTVSLKGLLYVMPLNFWIQMSGSFILSLLIQSILAFLLPSLVIVNQNFFYAVWCGLKVGAQNIILMSGIFFIPMFLILALSIAKMYTPLFVKGFYPEAVLWILSGGIVITLVVDILITTSATLVFLKGNYNNNARNKNNFNRNA